ncbi:Nem1-Spo7 phosphatase regulatory subunit [Recurvomyces mirabilis]|nr:Nem1-Spo7 phosphatase regulatory subunit [Recurvomyces mirabilis]
MTDNKLDQIVKGAPPPNISPSQVAKAAKSSSPSNPITTPHLPSNHTPSTTSTSTSPDPRDALPSSPPQIYLNLLILESSLRLQYLSLRSRLRLHTLLLFLLAAWLSVFTYLLFFRPREDGSGVGGSVYWVIETMEKLGWSGGVVTLCLVWGTGLYERGVRWPRRFVGTTNRGLRGLNMKVVVVKGSFLGEMLGWVGMLDAAGWVREERVDFQVLPKDIEASAAGSSEKKAGLTTEHWNAHATRHGLIEEDIAPSGDVLKLLLLPKPFSPDFREGWENFRLEYWERENARRADLRKLVRARKREVARREGGWLWWTGWRGWSNIRLFSSKSRRQLDLERLALRERKPGIKTAALVASVGRDAGGHRKRDSALLRSESHSRGSSRSSTPGPAAAPAVNVVAVEGGEGKVMSAGHVRRGSSSARRPKRHTALGSGSRLSATESVLDGGGEAAKRASTVGSGLGGDVKREDDEVKPVFAHEIKMEPAEA